MKSSGFNGCPPVGAQIVRPRVLAVFRGKIFGKARHAGRCRCRSLQIFSLAAGNRPSGRFASSSPQRGAPAKAGEGWFHATNLKNPKLQTKTTKPPGGKCFACCPAAFGIGRYLLVFFFHGVLAGFYGLFGGGFGAGGGFGQANAQGGQCFAAVGDHVREGP